MKKIVFVTLTTIFIQFINFSSCFSMELAKEKNFELQERFQDWFFYVTDRGDKKICYLLSTPVDSQKNNIRNESFFVVTNNNNDADEISTSSGYFYKKNSNVELSFGSNRFYLFPYLNFAWANDKNEDIDIIKEMQKKDQMFITGVSENGFITIDNYSLVGFLQAYRKMKEICK